MRLRLRFSKYFVPFKAPFRNLYLCFDIATFAEISAKTAICWEIRVVGIDNNMTWTIRVQAASKLMPAMVNRSLLILILG